MLTSPHDSYATLLMLYFYLQQRHMISHRIITVTIKMDALDGVDPAGHDPSPFYGKLICALLATAFSALITQEAH